MVRLRTLLLPALLAAANAFLAGRTDAQTAAPAATAAEFRVREGDILHVRVWPNTELGGEFPVEETGFVSLPIVGQVRAAGRPLGELRAELRQLYGRAIKSPVVTVTPEFQVGVLGAVNRPGLYPVKPAQTLADVISLAGGFRQDALEDRIQLVRDGKVIEIDAAQALTSGTPVTELALQSGDRVVVPERKRSALTLQNVAVLLQSGTFLLAIVNFIRN